MVVCADTLVEMCYDFQPWFGVALLQAIIASKLEAYHLEAN